MPLLLHVNALKHANVTRNTLRFDVCICTMSQSCCQTGKGGNVVTIPSCIFVVLPNVEIQRCGVLSPCISALQVAQGRLPESLPSVAKPSPRPNDICVVAQLGTIVETDIDMAEGAAGSNAATAATANEGELANAEPKLPLPENVQRACVFKVH